MKRPATVMYAATLTLLCGCTHVVTHNTPFFKDGPTQLAPPQGELKAGTWVWVTGKEGTYSHVLASDGTDAYVLENDLRPLWAPAPTAEQPPKKSAEPPAKPPRQFPLTRIAQ